MHVYDDALIELQLPSLRDATLAPAGAHALSIYVPDSERVGDRALALAERAIPNVHELVVSLVVHGPRELAVPNGQVHHVPHVPGAMYDRRGGARTGVDGVYRCGASAHPGGEVSGVPGWNAAQAVLEDLR